MYSRAREKDHFTIITTNKWIAVTKISKSVSKETFVKASKVVVKPSKVTFV